MNPRRWALWSLPRSVQGYLWVVAVCAFAIVAATANLVPITGRALSWFGLLFLGMIVHLEASRRIERIREIAAEGSPHTHLQSIWIFAALLLLPPPLVVAVIAISYGYSWVRVYQCRTPLHRKVFSACTVVLACWVAGIVLSLAQRGHGTGAPFIADLDGPAGLGVLVAAGALYFAVNHGLVVAVILMSNPDQPGRAALGRITDALTIGASVGLATAIALIMTLRPWLLPVLMLTMLALHLGLLLPQFQAASRTDAKTGLVNSVFWHEMAHRELARARAIHGTVGILIVDLDHFKRINDRYGHLAGDQVLLAVAEAMKHEVRSFDLIGRFGGEEFVVLLPGVTIESIRRLADRIRMGINLIVVEPDSTMTGPEATIYDLTASVGAAVYPDTATELPALLMAADAALYAAKTTGRNKTCMAPAADTIAP